MKSEQGERRWSAEPLIWTRRALRIPGKCFPVKGGFLKIEDCDTFPFVLRTEKEECQVQNNGFCFVIGRNIRAYKLALGRRNIPFSGTAGKGDTEAHGGHPAQESWRLESSRKRRYRQNPGAAREAEVLSSQGPEQGYRSCFLPYCTTPRGGPPAPAVSPLWYSRKPTGLAHTWGPATYS